MAKSALHPWVEARPSPLKGASKKAFFTFIIFCAVFTQRTSYETHSNTTRIHPVIYFTTATHSINSAQLFSAAEKTYTDATTREKFPEASPKGPGPTHIRALAGQRSQHKERTLVTQGLASRSTKVENKQPSPENNAFYNQQKTTPSHTCIPLIKFTPDIRNSPRRRHTRKGGGCRTHRAT